MVRPLEGIRVIELGQYIRVPYCCKLLADLGAEVIKVEPPGIGDKSRKNGPFPGGIPHPERSGLFIYINNNKLSITLDPTTKNGKKLLLDLIAQADLMVDEYKPKEREHLGLEYLSLSFLNPSLVLTSITAFGQEGPYANYKGHSLQLAAGSVANRIGDPGRPPLAPPLSQADYYAGLHGSAASLVALYARKLTGRGQFVDISALECLSNSYSSIQSGNIYYHMTTDSQRGGYRSNALYPLETLPCKDGYFNITTTIVPHWQRYLEAMGNPEWAQDSKVQNLDREYVTMHRDELDAHQMAWLANYTKQELGEIFQGYRLPFYPVKTIAEVVESEQLRSRNYFQRLDHPDAGPVTLPGQPFQLSESSGELTRPAPSLGQDNEEVFSKRLGYSDANLAKWGKEGVI